MDIIELEFSRDFNSVFKKKIYKMKKKLYALTVLLLLTMISFSCSQKLIKENPYHLNLVSDIETYRQQIRKDTDNNLIDLEKYIPEIVLDIRYATKNNFTGQKLYKMPKAYARKPVARVLLKIQNELKKQGLGLKIYDAYRPYAVTLKFYRIYRDTNFVAAPWKGSSHNTGCAVDLTLIDLDTGKELEMPTGFDDFTEKASHNYMNLSEKVLQNRQLLKNIMQKYGFVPYEQEWWHYRYKDSGKFGLLDLGFEELENK